VAKRRTKTKTSNVYRSISGKFEIAYRDSDGKLRFKTVDGDIEAAKRVLADVVSRKAKGERVAPSRVTLDQYAQDVYFPSLLLRPRTIEIYKASYRLYVAPTLGHRPLTSITVDDVAKLIASLTRRGYAAWTVRGVLTVLGRIFATAERASLVPSNPIRKLDQGERPAASQREQRILSSDDSPGCSTSPAASAGSSRSAHSRGSGWGRRSACAGRTSTSNKASSASAPSSTTNAASSS